MASEAQRGRLEGQRLRGVDWRVRGGRAREEAASITRGAATHHGERGQRLRVVTSHRLAGWAPEL